MADLKRLLHVRKIFIESIDNMLSDRLMEAVGKSGRFQIAAEAKDADAIVRGTCVDLRRLKSLHSEVYISDRVTGAPIWQDSVRRPFNPPALTKAVDDSAALIVQHLNDDVQQAQRH